MGHLLEYRPIVNLPDLPTFSINLEELLVAAVLGTAIYLLEWLLFSKYRRRPVGTLVVKQEPVFDRDMAALRGEVARLHARIELLEQQLADKSKEAEVKETAALSPYAKATQLARQGVSVGDLSEHCGISRGEAELIVALNSPSR